MNNELGAAGSGEARLHAGPDRGVSDWNPAVPEGVKGVDVLQGGEMNDDFEKGGARCVQRGERLVDLCENLRNLGAGICGEVGGDFDPASGALMDYDIRPAWMGSDAADGSHGRSMIGG